MERLIIVKNALLISKINFMIWTTLPKKSLEFMLISFSCCLFHNILPVHYINDNASVDQCTHYLFDLPTMYL